MRLGGLELLGVGWLGGTDEGDLTRARARAWVGARVRARAKARVWV